MSETIEITKQTIASLQELTEFAEDEIPKDRYFDAMQPFYAALEDLENGLELLKKIQAEMTSS